MRFGKFRILIKENGDWDRYELSFKKAPPSSQKWKHQKTNNKNPELKQVCRHIFFVKDFVLWSSEKEGVCLYIYYQ